MYWDLLHGLRQHHIRTTVCKKPTHIPHPLSIHQEWKDLNPVGETGRSLQPDFQSPLKTVWMERSRDLVQHSVPWKGLLWTKLIQLIQGKRPSIFLTYPNSTKMIKDLKSSWNSNTTSRLYVVCSNYSIYWKFTFLFFTFVCMSILHVWWIFTHFLHWANEKWHRPFEMLSLKFSLALVQQISVQRCLITVTLPHLYHEWSQLWMIESCDL